jgi:hypothetical protein
VVDRTVVVGVKKLGVPLAALAAVLIAAFLIAAPAWSQAEGGNVDVQYVDCSQVQNAAANQGQYGTAIGREARVELSQELNISQEQVNACLGNIGNNDDDRNDDDNNNDDDDNNNNNDDDVITATGEETTVLAATIPDKKVLAATGGPASISGIFALVMLGSGLLLASAVRRDR